VLFSFDSTQFCVYRSDSTIGISKKGIGFFFVWLGLFVLFVWLCCFLNLGLFLFHWNYLGKVQFLWAIRIWEYGEIGGIWCGCEGGIPALWLWCWFLPTVLICEELYWGILNGSMWLFSCCCFIKEEEWSLWSISLLKKKRKIIFVYQKRKGKKERWFVIIFFKKMTWH
jgi:hypothetical protein